MTEYIVDGSNGPNFAKEQQQEQQQQEDGHYYVPHKEIFVERSPRSPLSTHSPHLSSESDSLDLPIEELVNHTSIDQLYHNVCEMQSSDQSPSRRSFLSYGEESRIDSELRFFAGGDYSVTVETKHKDEIISNNNKDESKVHSANNVINKSSSPPTTRQAKRLSSNGKPPRCSKKNGPMKKVGTNLQNGKEDYLGPYLLKQARDLNYNDGNSEKALELALRAKKSFESSPGPKPDLDYVLCLHVVSALYCRLGMYAEAIPILEKSIDIPSIDLGQNHALAKFAGCMQLGDTYAMLGQIENSILFYTAGLEIQRQVLGENDLRFGETCRYLAEAHVQALQFDEAERLCATALNIHRENNGGKSGSPEEAADRRLLGIICESKGDYENALEHYVLASMAMMENADVTAAAAIDCSIGDAYLSLARYDEAVFAYQKALNMFKSSRGEEDHAVVASIFVRLADLYNKIGKFNESKSYCENAIRIYSKPLIGTPTEEIASGLVDVSAIYEAMNEPERALELLQKAIKLYGDKPGQQSIIAGIEAQMGVLHYILGSYSESYESLKNATEKFRSIGEKKSALFGIALNQMGLACVQIYSINEAAELFEEAREVLETECGPYHADTLGVYSNLAGTYDAMGRISDAIEILEYVVDLREERLGTANPDVDDEKRRLAVLLKEAGLVRRKKSRSLETLLDKHIITTPFDIQGS